jgi:hypothetical protein
MIVTIVTRVCFLSAALTVVILLAAFFVATSVAAQPQRQEARTPASPDGASNAPWSVLPDGRIVIDIYNRRIAIPSCTTCLRDVQFYAPGSPTHEGGLLGLGDAIREVIAASPWVGLMAGNSWNEPGRYLQKFDRRTLPSTPYLMLTVYRHPATTLGCWPHADVLLRPLCASLIKAAIPAPHTPTADGLIVVTSNAPELLFGSTRYVVPLVKIESAVGLPMYFDCERTFHMCANGFNPGTGPGFLIAPDLSISFYFGETEFPRSEWIALHQRVQVALTSLIADSVGER